MHGIPRIPFIVLAIQLSGLCADGQVKFTTAANSQQIGKGDYLQVEFRVENAKEIDQFAPPDFHDFQVLEEPSQSSGMSVINGNMSQYKALTYDLKPLKTGKFIIDGATALVDGKKMRSNPITITVTAASSSSGNNGSGSGNNNPANPFPALPWPDPPALAPQDIDRDYVLRPGEDVKEKINKNLFVKVQVDKNTCYVGEPIVATYKLYSRLRVESRETKHPSLNGFSVYDMVDPGNEPSFVEKLDGRSFMVHILRKAQLIPLLSGTIDLDPAELDNTVHFIKATGKPVHKRSGDALQDLFDQLSDANAVAGPEVEENVTIDSKPLTITVKPLPEKNKPADFNGAVGKFSIASALVNRNVNAEDEADLKVTVKGSGNLPVINAPLVLWPGGVNAFDPNAKEDVNKTTVPLSGTKTFDYIFTTQVPGHYRIPPVAFSYFDPSAQVYKRIHSDPVDFEVTAAPKKKGQPAGVIIAPASGWDALKDLVQEHLEALFAILILSGLAFYLWRQNLRLKRSEKEGERPGGTVRGGGRVRAGGKVRGSAGNRGNAGGEGNAGNAGSEGNATGSAGKSGAAAGSMSKAEAAAGLLSDVRVRLENNDYKGFYRELNRVVWKAIADKLDLPSSELNKYNIIRKLEAKGWDATTTFSLEHLLNECEMNLYTPDHDTYNMQQLLGQAESLLRILISDTSY